MKTLRIALASAALAGAALAAPATAADLHYGSMKDGYRHMPLPQAAVGPCYFRGDIGYSFSNSPTVKWPVTSATPDDTTGSGWAEDGNGNIVYTTSDKVSGVSMDNTWLIETGVGCSMNPGGRGFRGDFTLGYRGHRKIKGEPRVYYPVDTDPSYEVDDPLHTAVTSYTALLNVYYDLGNFRGWMPYVGAGIGTSYHRMREVYFTENPYLTNRILGNNDLSFTWALMVGVGYQVSSNVVLDVGYRYIDFGSIHSQQVDDAHYWNPAVRVDDMSAHEIKVGLRYSFGSSCCATGYAPLK